MLYLGTYRPGWYHERKGMKVVMLSWRGKRGEMLGRKTVPPSLPWHIPGE